MSIRRTSQAGTRRAPGFRTQGLEGRLAVATEVEILNISLGGVAVKVDRRLNLGSECTLELQRGRRPDSVRARIVWSALTGFRRKGRAQTPEYSVGMRFVDVINEKGAALVELLRRNRNEKEQRLSGFRVQLSARGRAVLTERHPFKVKRISLGGMLIEIGKELEEGHTYPMEVQLDERLPIQVMGRIISRLELAPKKHEIGVELVQIAAGDKARLKSLVQSLSRDNKKR